MSSHLPLVKGRITNKGLCIGNVVFPRAGYYFSKMIAFKVVILAVAGLAVNTSPAKATDDNKSPSSPKQLPLEKNDLFQSNFGGSMMKGIEKPKRTTRVAANAVPGASEPHRLSKRFSNPRWNMKRASHFPGSSDSWMSVAGNDKLRYYDPDVIDLLLGYPKPKRFIGLLPAKEPRRKDMPPRLGEESAPKFTRAFSFPEDPQSHTPSVRAIIDGLLEKLPQKFSDQRKLYSPRLRVDTPININRIDVELGKTDDDYSDVDSAEYSPSITSIGSELDDDASSSSDEDETDGFDDLNDGGDAFGSREADLAGLNQPLQKLLAQIHEEMARVHDTNQI